MIELNLLPNELRKKKIKIELPEIPLIPIAAIFIGVLLIVQVILGSLIFLSKRQLTSLDKKWETLLPKKAKFNKLKKRITVTSKKVEAIEGLMEKQLNWSRLLNELSNSLTANIWFTNLSYDERTERRQVAPSARRQKGKKGKIKKEDKAYKIGSLRLAGSASGEGEEPTAFIAHFIKALKDNENFFREFDKIELISIKKSQVAGENVMNFTLVSSFKPKET